jgi:hypothetical protein
MNNETNFFDLCAAGCRALGRACKACGRTLGRMTRLTFRFWWVVFPVLALAIAGAWYYTRPDNLTFKVNAVAFLNGPSIQQFDQAYAPLQSGQLLPGDAAIAPYVHSCRAKSFTTYRVIDCLDDGTADYIDFRRKSKATDTVQVQLKDRLCLQFRVKLHDIPQVPVIEQALLDLLNNDPVLIQSYETYLRNLREEVAFNHRQAQKLDSLTSQYYFFNPALAQQEVVGRGQGGVSFYGDRRVRLFLKEIYEQHEYMQRMDYRLQLATAPVTLENHFRVDPKPVNGRRKNLILFAILGWFAGCGIAELIDRRKAICAWMKQ